MDLKNLNIVNSTLQPFRYSEQDTSHQGAATNLVSYANAAGRLFLRGVSNLILDVAIAVGVVAEGALKALVLAITGVVQVVISPFVGMKTFREGIYSLQIAIEHIFNNIPRQVASGVGRMVSAPYQIIARPILEPLANSYCLTT